MKRYAKYLAGAAALTTVGFLLAVGLMSVLFSKKTGTFAPTSSADAASWVQAIGSIAAILSAYHLGSRQASEARRRTELQANEKANRRRANLIFTETTCNRVLLTAFRILERRPSPEWRNAVPVAIRETTSGLAGLREIPHSEIEPPEKVKHLTEIRAALEALLTAQQTCADAIEKSTVVPKDPLEWATGNGLAESQMKRDAAGQRLRERTNEIAFVIERELTELLASPSGSHPVSPES